MVGTIGIKKEGGTPVSLNIVPGEVITYLVDVFGALWPILALGLGIAAVPRLISATKTVFSRR